MYNAETVVVIDPAKNEIAINHNQISLNIRVHNIEDLKTRLSLKNDLEYFIPDLSSVIKQGQAGFLYAEIPANVYFRGLENALKQAGVDFVVITDALKEDLNFLTPAEGYHLRSQQVSWIQNVQNFDEFQASFSSKNRRRINAKLAKSSDLRCSIDELSEKNFKRWFAVYEQLFDQKERGRKHLDANWGKQNLAKGYKLLSISDPVSRRYLGGVILNLKLESDTLIMAYQAFSSEFRNLDLGLRAVCEAMKYAADNNFQKLSHGTDHNLYGYYLDAGLMQFKMSLGFEPKPAGKIQVLKIINFDKFSDQTCFFSLKIEGTDKFSKLQHYANQPVTFSLANNLELELSEQKPIIIPEIKIESYFDVIKHWNPSDGKQLDQWWKAQGLRDGAPRNWISPLVQASRLGELASIRNLTYRSHWCFTQFVERACVAGFFDEKLQPDKNSLKFKSTADFAKILGRNFNSEISQMLASEVLLESFKTTDLILDLQVHEGQSFWIQLFEKIEDQFGVNGLFEFQLNLQNCLRPEELEPGKHNYNPLSSELTHPMTFSDIDWQQYFAADKIEEAQQICQSLLKLYLSYGLPFHRSSRDETFFTDTFAGKGVAYIASFLENTEQVLKDLSAGQGAYKAANHLKYFQDYKKLASLKIDTADINIDPAKNFITELIANNFSSISGLKNSLIFAGIDPDCLNFVGSSATKIAQEFIGRVEYTELVVFLEAMLENNSQRIKDINIILEKLFELGANPWKKDLPPLKLLTTQARDIWPSIKELRILEGDSEHGSDKFINYLVNYLKLNRASDVNDEQQTYRARDVLLEYYYQHQEFLVLEVAEIKNLVVDYANASGDLNPLMLWYANHYDSEFTPETIELLLTSIEKTVNNAFTWAEATVLLNLISKNLETDRAFEALRRCEAIHVIFDIRQSSIRALESMRETSTRLHASVARKDVIALLTSVFIKHMLSNVEEVLNKEQRSLSNSHNGLDSTAICVLLFLSASEDAFSEIKFSLMQMSVLEPLEVRSLIRAILSQKTCITELLSVKYLHELYFKSLLADTGEFGWGLNLSILSSPLLTFKFDPELAITPSSRVTAWFLNRNNCFSVDQNEVKEFILWNFSHPDFKIISEVDIALLKLLEKFENQEVLTEIYNVLSRSLETRIFTPKAMLVFQELKDDWIEEQLQRCSLSLVSKKTLDSYPWTKLGYSEEFESYFNLLLKTENLQITDQQAEKILVFLTLAQKNQREMSFFDATIMGSTPISIASFVQLIDEFWKLGIAESKKYIALRIKEHLTTERSKLKRACTEKYLNSIQRQIQEHKVAQRLSEAEKLEAREKLLLDYKAYLINPPENIEATSFYDVLQVAKIKLELNPSVMLEQFYEIQEEEFLIYVKNNSEINNFYLKNKSIFDSSGIAGKISRFLTFADQEGLKRLEQVLLLLSDPNKVSVIEVVHPELSGQIFKHFNYFAKFESLITELKALQVSEESLNAFSHLWVQPWYFSEYAIADKENEIEWLRVSHDVERWCKHGDEPIKSCQRLSSSAGVMREENWNYQFGPIANNNGRPLSRILLPQLKLAEGMANGEVVVRAVLEVVPSGSGSLSLLVENFYSNSEQLHIGFRAEIMSYAKCLGIHSEQVYFADDKPKDYPRPQLDEYRIYRDYFRPEN